MMSMTTKGDIAPRADGESGVLAASGTPCRKGALSSETDLVILMPNFPIFYGV
jgi:hypothetical protein